MGGKIAMQLALSQPQLVSALVVADIAPVAYPSHHDQVFAALNAWENGRASGVGRVGGSGAARRGGRSWWPLMAAPFADTASGSWCSRRT